MATKYDHSALWPKGKSGNPGGRPKGLGRVVRETIGDDLPAMTQMLKDIALARGSQVGFHIRDRLKAFEILFDRGWGKAHQTVDVTATEAPPTALALDAMADEELELLLGVLAPRIIDVVPQEEPPPVAPAVLSLAEALGAPPGEGEQ